MIDETQVRRYCREDLSLIENYDEAVRSEEPYHCHHRYELNDGIVLSMNDLKKMGLYFKRPESELIFLKRIDHYRLHTKGSAHPFYGKHCSEETKEKIRKSLSGDNSKFAKPVIQLSKDGVLVKKWSSTREAERKLGIKHTNISACCKGKLKTAGGFKWVYADKYVPRTKSISDIKTLL